MEKNRQEIMASVKPVEMEQIVQARRPRTFAPQERFSCILVQRRYDLVLKAVPIY